MTQELDAELEAHLRDVVLRTVGADVLVDLRIKPYVDYNDEDALRFTLVLREDRFDQIDRITVMSNLVDALRARRLDLFPYTTLLTDREAA